MKTTMQAALPRALRPTAVLAGALLFAGTARAQITFSIDYESDTVADIAGGVARPITPGDILAPQAGGLPQIPPTGANLPTPALVFGGGVTPGVAGQLGIQSHDDCIGVDPGVQCPSELDALSYGMDDLVPDPSSTGPPGTGSFSGVSASTQKGRWQFSVDEYAEGLVGAAPDVNSENALVAALGTRAGDSSADVFTNLEFSMAPPLGPLDPVAGNVGIVDGDGQVSSSSFMLYPGTGLKEPNAPLTPPGATPGDNLDALDCGAAIFPVFFSLEGALFDPKGMAVGTGTAGANGFSGADILVTATSGALPTVYASAVALGLDQAGIGTDDVDALCLLENGTPGYQASTMPYDWVGGATDQLFFSVRRGSAILGALDSIFGAPIEEGDILVPPVAGGTTPGIFIAAEVLGLRTLRNFDPCGDDLDALDYKEDDRLLSSEYCFGDGGVTLGATVCTPCPCGNDNAPGSKTGCINSAGTGARLIASGIASITADTLRFEVAGANVSTFGVLLSAPSRLPLMGTCMGAGIAPINLDGLRCIGGGIARNGARPSDSSGNIGFTTNGWGPPNGPTGGLLSFGGLIACQTRQFQVFYRELPTAQCMTGQNTTQGVQIIVTP